MKTSRGALSRALFCVLSALALPAAAQTLEQLKKDAASTGDVLTYGMGWSQQRYSTLKAINAGNVGKLVPVWNFSTANLRGEQSQPLLVNGVIYYTTHDATFAVHALKGTQIWKTPVEYPPETPRSACCGIVNRGPAAYNGKLFRTTLDAQVVALDMKTGKELWKQKAAEFKDGYSMTVAPLVADGVLITGISGGEYGTRGFIDGWDPETGKRLWRRYTIPAPGEKGGDTWPAGTHEKGGGSTWLTGSYDPELDLVYWGIGNGGPWNGEARKGDNLYICSVLALRPKTGEIVWHYQFTPNDMYDYDGANELVLADLTVGGAKRKVLMQANRNGFFYVLDRTNGTLLAANKFVDNVNWADRIDMKSGRPVESELTRKARAGEAIEVWPSPFGGKNWSPMAYNPGTGLAYANTLNFGMPYKIVPPEYKKGEWYLGVELTGWAWPKNEPRGYLRAIDPLTGKYKWQRGWDIPSFSGVLTTAGGLVFTGSMTGEFYALDARTGKELWKFKTGSGIVSQPITWQHNGVQYVTVGSGIGGVYAAVSGDERLGAVPTGGSLWTFALTK
jgi:alcohol dehydrogenase (cytochrome c)